MSTFGDVHASRNFHLAAPMALHEVIFPMAWRVRARCRLTEYRSIGLRLDVVLDD